MSDEDAKIIIGLLEDIRKLLYQTLCVHAGVGGDEEKSEDAALIAEIRTLRADLEGNKNDNVEV